jgi:hypothetical protein
MSRAYTTTSRMMMTSAEHQDVVVVVGCDAATGPPSTPYCPDCPINSSGDLLLPPPTQSATVQSYTGSRQTDLTHARRREEHPPRLLPTKTIPLPALADIPISVNPVLSYTPSKIVLEYELSLPPSTARLPPTTKTHVGRWDWRRQPAMDPSTVGSMTIRVPGLERLVVVFPATLESTVVTVDDVLIAVHRAVQAMAMELHTGFGTKYGQRRIPGSSPMILTPWPTYEHTTVANQDRSGGHNLWAGLYPCQKERDVWVLRTRRVSNR